MPHAIKRIQPIKELLKTVDFSTASNGISSKNMQMINAVSTFSPRQAKHFILHTKISSCNFVNNTLLKLLYKTRVLCKCKTEIQGKSIWVRDSTRFELARVQFGLLSQSQKSISYIRNHTDYLMTDKEVELKGFINQRTNKDNKCLCRWNLFGLVLKKTYKNLIT